jgi:DNA sulfur modification protein DndC
MEKLDNTIANIKAKLLQGYILNIGLSGKDSLIVSHCAIEALRQAYEIDPNVGPLYLMTTDTTIDNFEVFNYIKSVHAAAVQYGDEMGLPINSKLVKPSLLTQPLISYIGRGKLLRTPQTTRHARDCTIDWKILPASNFMKQLRAQYQTDKILSLSGTRDDESAIRAKNIAKRGETIDTIATTDLGFTMAPIKDWDLNDIWRVANLIENGDIESFAEDCIQGLFKHYSAGNGGMCDIYVSDSNKPSKACGSRFGCTLCALVPNDTSLEQQIKTSPKTYGYMQGINDLRTFMLNTLNDMERSRSLLGRDEKAGGYLKVGWNQYSIEYRQELLTYVLTLDQLEQERAQALGVEPKFELIGYKELIAIQYLWAKQGGEKHIASAFKIWHDIKHGGKRYPIPHTDCADLKGYTFSLGQARFIGGDSLAPYRYVKITDFENRLCSLDDGRDGLETRAGNHVSVNELPRIQNDDGSYITVVPHQAANAFTVTDEECAKVFVEDRYLSLLELGLDSDDPYHRNCPTLFLKVMLFENIITIKKGQIKQLHKDAKRAQVINAVNLAGRHFESVFLAHSISETEYKAALVELETDTADAAPQMALFG